MPFFWHWCWRCGWVTVVSDGKIDFSSAFITPPTPRSILWVQFSISVATSFLLPWSSSSITLWSEVAIGTSRGKHCWDKRETDSSCSCLFHTFNGARCTHWHTPTHSYCLKLIVYDVFDHCYPRYLDNMAKPWWRKEKVFLGAVFFSLSGPEICWMLIKSNQKS